VLPGDAGLATVDGFYDCSSKKEMEMANTEADVDAGMKDSSLSGKGGGSTAKFQGKRRLNANGRGQAPLKEFPQESRRLSPILEHLDGREKFLGIRKREEWECVGGGVKCGVKRLPKD